MAFTFTFEIDNSSCPSIITVVLIGSGDKIERLSTPFRIEPIHWCPVRKRPQNIYLKKYKKLHVRLNSLRIAITTYLHECDTNCQHYSLRKLANLIRNEASKERTNPVGSLLDCTEKYIESRIHLISSSTRKRYYVFYKLIQKFEGFLGRRLSIPDVNASMLTSFLAFCTEELYSRSTMHRTVHFIRTILNHLEKRGVRTFVYELELPREMKETEIVTLTEEELVRIKRMNIDHELQAARDWLVISCYTGQRFSDFMRFNKDMIKHVEGKEYLVFHQQKTKKMVHLPLHPAVKVIMVRNSNRFPPKLSYNIYNKAIKSVVKAAGCDLVVTVNKRTGFRSAKTKVCKWQATTTHIGRRSFASNFYGRIPTPLLMEATGHSSELMFQRYINPVDTQRILSLNRHFEETYKTTFTM